MTIKFHMQNDVKLKIHVHTFDRMAGQKLASEYIFK